MHGGAIAIKGNTIAWIGPASGAFLAPHQIYAMVRQNVRVGLGTDGPGSRGTLDMFQVMHYAVMGTAIANSTPYHSFQLPLDYAQMLKIACVNGARVANLESKTGCLQKGRLADIVLVGRNDFDQYPSTDPLATLAEMTTGREHGRWSLTGAWS